MSRAANLGDVEVFRAVITKTHPATEEREERVFTEAAGPYRTAGAGAAAITLAVREARRWGSTAVVTGRVERASLVWEPVS